jgi:hypothetical protein
MAPAIVAIGNRSVLVYDIVPDPAVPRSRAGIVTVSVLSQDGWHLAGVLGSGGGSALIVERVVANGLDAALQPLVQSAGGTVQLAWIAPAPPVSTPAAEHPPKPRPRRVSGGSGVKRSRSSRTTTGSRKTTRTKSTSKKPAGRRGKAGSKRRKK